MSAPRDRTNGQFVKSRIYECSTWFERDRAHVSLELNGVELFSLWDDDVMEAIEDGFLTIPNFHTRATNADWLPHLIAYAKEVGVTA